jgi:hypothetical protein
MPYITNGLVPQTNNEGKENDNNEQEQNTQQN